MSVSQNSGKTHNVCGELVYFTTYCGLVSLGSFSLVFIYYMFHEIVHMFAWMLKSLWTPFIWLRVLFRICEKREIQQEKKKETRKHRASANI